MNKKNKVMFLVIGVCLLLILVGGVTYAYFTAGIETNHDENKVTDITTSTITKATMDLGDKIEANGVLPGYKVVKTIRVTGEGNENSLPVKANIVLMPEVTDFPNHVKYSVYELDTSNQVDASNICTESREITTGGMYYDEMTCDTSNLGNPILEGIFEGTKSVSKEIEVRYNTDKTYYVLIEYINDEENDQNSEKGKYFEVTIDYKEHYKEEILNGTDPILSEGLIPVTIDENGTVRKANISEKWYEYGNQEWANAVILLDETKKYQSNEVIPESEIESYFVWIPKYRYQLWDLGEYNTLTTINENQVHEIPIIFGDYNTKDEIDGECKTSMVSGSSGTCKKEDYMTHPAFLSIPSKGMWVGKFETGYKSATTTASAEQNLVDIDKIQIKPNVYSWRGIQVANAHLNSYNYKREYDSHMMKNTEWGAIAYLSHSAYGSRSSVRINNNESNITGYAAKNEPTCGSYSKNNNDCNIYESTNLGVDGTNTFNYFNNLSNVASTTGNKTGIYDMSGGSYEYMMGVMLDQNGNLVSGTNDKLNSNFIGTLTDPTDGNNINKTSWTEDDGGIPYPEEKYYDIYQCSTSNQEYNRRILGDATGEMGPFEKITFSNLQNHYVSSWHENNSYFIFNSRPFVVRGGNYFYGRSAGIFNYNSNSGTNGYETSFRIILTL